MNCDRAIELMSAHIDGMLDAEEERLLQVHLEACPKCRDELAALEKTVSLVKGLEEVDVPPRFLENVHRRLNERRPSGVVIWRVFSMPQAQAALAAGLLVALSFFAYHEYGSPRRAEPEEKEMVAPARGASAEVSAEKADEPVLSVQHVGKDESVPADAELSEMSDDKSDRIDAVDAAEQVHLRKAVSRRAEASPKKEAVDVMRDRAAVPAPRNAAVPAAPAVEMEAASAPAGRMFGMADAEEGRAGAAAMADTDKLKAAEPEAIRESVAEEEAPTSVNVTIAADDVAAVAEIVREFMPVRKEEAAGMQVRAKRAARAEAAELPDSFVLTLSPRDYRLLVARLKKIGKVTSVASVEPVAAKAEELDPGTVGAATGPATMKPPASGVIKVRVTIVPVSEK